MAESNLLCFVNADILCRVCCIVFVFLIILVLIMKLMSMLVKAMEKYFPQAVPQAAAAGTDNALVALAIAAAKRFQGK